MGIKNLLRLSLNFLHLDLTKNLEYDRYTKLIMKRVISSNSNCIDVGCHKGEILDTILSLSPEGRHFGFEPIPVLFEQLKTKYSGRAEILPYALADHHGTSSFQFVKNAPAYSGLIRRKYDIETPDIEEIRVELRTLDELIPDGLKIDFIKIDVEGGEFGVLKGAKQLILKSNPVIVFESGLGASEFYGTKPADLFQFLTEETGMKISLLKSFIERGSPLSPGQFENSFNSGKEYYFIAHS